MSIWRRTKKLLCPACSRRAERHCQDRRCIWITCSRCKRVYRPDGRSISITD